MTTVSVAELKAHLGRYLDWVRKGKTVIVTSHRHPVARIERIPSAHGTPRAAPPRLPSAALDALTPLRLARPVDAVSLLLEDRARR